MHRLSRYELLDGGKSTLYSTVKDKAKTKVFLGTRDCIHLIHHKWSSYLLKLVLDYITGDRNFYRPTANPQMIQS